VSPSIPNSGLALSRPRPYMAGKPFSAPASGMLLYQEDENRMSTFDQRKDAFENKFAHDEELRFKATARRNKLLGLWAAEKLGKSGTDADAYAKSVVVADFEEAGDEDVVRKVKSDFVTGGVTVADDEVRRVMTELLIRAAEEIQAGR
jgi:hypothetical protein